MSIVFTFTPRLAVELVTAATIAPLAVTGAPAEALLDGFAEPQAANKQRNGTEQSALTESIDFLSHADSELLYAV